MPAGSPGRSPARSTGRATATCCATRWRTGPVNRTCRWLITAQAAAPVVSAGAPGARAVDVAPSVRYRQRARRRHRCCSAACRIPSHGSTGRIELGRGVLAGASRASRAERMRVDTRPISRATAKRVAQRQCYFPSQRVVARHGLAGSNRGRYLRQPRWPWDRDPVVARSPDQSAGISWYA